MRHQSHAVFLETDALEAFIGRLYFDTMQCLPAARPLSIGISLADRREVAHKVDELLTGAIAKVDQTEAGPVAMVTEDAAAASEMTPSSASTEAIALPAQCPVDTKSLLKALMRFLHVVVSEATFATALRSILETHLPVCLETLLRAPKFFGTSLWYLASKWVMEYANMEPLLLPTLQEVGLPQAILDVVSDSIPESDQLLSELPSILSAICLNEQGLEMLRKADPFKAIVATFVTPRYMPCMGYETPAILGTDMDELLRHQPSLRPLAMHAIADVLQTIKEIGHDDNVKVIAGECCGGCCSLVTAQLL